RGTLSVGHKADVNVIDLSQLSERMPQIAYDFPNAAPRFIQRARGYEATFCNGSLIASAGELTGLRSGSVLRHGR
ncbi:MAG: hypothetical protein O2858_08920, partial [Proteobacteria bacterium]|nr:hypothetical protein [Pseudomonadota bacterium]